MSSRWAVIGYIRFFVFVYMVDKGYRRGRNASLHMYAVFEILIRRHASAGIYPFISEERAPQSKPGVSIKIGRVIQTQRP